MPGARWAARQWPTPPRAPPSLRRAGAQRAKQRHARRHSARQNVSQGAGVARGQVHSTLNLRQDGAAGEEKGGRGAGRGEGVVRRRRWGGCAASRAERRQAEVQARLATTPVCLTHTVRAQAGRLDAGWLTLPLTGGDPHRVRTLPLRPLAHATLTQRSRHVQVVQVLLHGLAPQPAAVGGAGSRERLALCVSLLGGCRVG